MKTYFTLFLLFVSVNLFSQEDFILQLNDTSVKISLDNEYTVQVNGQSINLRLIAKDTLLFEKELFSFMHLKDYKVGESNVDEGIDQFILMTAEGSGFLIQQYKGFNPEMLNEMMLSEVIKESLNYGYKMKRKDYRREISTGQKVDVCKAVLTYKGDKSIYEVASVGFKDEGILIMTMISDTESAEQGEAMIELMWESLKYKD